MGKLRLEHGSSLSGSACLRLVHSEQFDHLHTEIHKFIILTLLPFFDPFTLTAGLWDRSSMLRFLQVPRGFPAPSTAVLLTPTPQLDPHCQTQPGPSKQQQKSTMQSAQAVECCHCCWEYHHSAGHKLSQAQSLFPSAGTDTRHSESPSSSILAALY